MRPRRNSQEQPWGRLLEPHQQIYSTISLSHSADTETPPRWEKLMINSSMLPTSMQTPDQLDLKVDDADSLPHHQPIRGMSMNWSCPLWTITVKTSIFTKLGYSFEGTSLLCPLLPGKVIKQSFFSPHPKLCLWDSIWQWYTEKLSFQHHRWPPKGGL